MEPRPRWIIAIAALLCVVGCGRTEETSPLPADPMTTAQRAFRSGDFDRAAATVQQLLLVSPDDDDARLLAGEIEAARGNHQAAIDLAASIDLQSRLAKRAVELQTGQLLVLQRYNDAVAILLAGLEQLPTMTDWREQAWTLLNRLGRREEASLQADVLCREAEIRLPQLVSLLRRGQSFPTVLPPQQSADSLFEPGLGLARWHFSRGDHRQAIEQLADQAEHGFECSDAAALYGRLLAETQQGDALALWHARCPDDTAQRSDYWAALGAHFFDQNQLDGSAHALLQAVARNPTDELSTQRLAKVFDALGRPADAEQFRQRGILIVQSKQQADAWFADPHNPEIGRRLAQQTLALGRPFEAITWSLATLPTGDTQQQSALQAKLQELGRSPVAVSMAFETSLVGLHPSDFDLQPALQTLQPAATEATAGGSIQANPTGPLATPRLINVAHDRGLRFQWYCDVENNLASIPIHEMMGGSIAVLDYDLDGWPDVYLGQGSGDPPTAAATRSDVLYRNLQGQFVEVTGPAQTSDFHYSSGIAAGDVNQDGFADLFLGSLGHNRLLINNGDGSFRDATHQLGSGPDLFTASLAIADINADGLPDLFEACYIEMDGGFRPPDRGPDGREIVPTPLSHFAQSDRWFENLGDGRFAAHMIDPAATQPGTSLGVVISDFDGDNDNEVLVGNDARPNHLLVQAGQNKFQNLADANGIANGFSGAADACMGIASGDFNRDGRIDFSITNFVNESSNLFLQTASGGFTDFATRYGLDQHSKSFVGFGTKALDIDRNGWLDLLVSNGHVFDTQTPGEQFRMPPQVLLHHGDRFEAADVDDESGYWDGTYVGRSMALIDFDRDGAIDVLINHLDQPTALLHNQTQAKGQTHANGGDWFQLELVGTHSERDAIGARVTVHSGGQQWTQWVTAGDGYLCSDQPLLDFGIGTGRSIERVEIAWPSGIRQSFSDVTPGRRYLAIENQSQLHD